MKWTHCIDKVAKKCGHSSPFMLFRLMLMLDNLQEVKTILSSNFDNYKGIREGLPAGNRGNGIHRKDTAKKQAKILVQNYEEMLRSNTRRWMETNNLPLDIRSAGPTSIVFCNGYATKRPLILDKV